MYLIILSSGFYLFPGDSSRSEPSTDPCARNGVRVLRKLKHTHTRHHFRRAGRGSAVPPPRARFCFAFIAPPYRIAIVVTGRVLV